MAHNKKTANWNTSIPPIQIHCHLHWQKACVIAYVSIHLYLKGNIIFQLVKLAFWIQVCRISYQDGNLPDSPGLKRPPGSIKMEFFTCNSSKWGCLNNSTWFNTQHFDIVTGAIISHSTGKKVLLLSSFVAECHKIKEPIMSREIIRREC